jgi:hypothetical protein
MEGRVRVVGEVMKVLDAEAAAGGERENKDGRKGDVILTRCLFDEAERAFCVRSKLNLLLKERDDPHSSIFTIARKTVVDFDRELRRKA